MKCRNCDEFADDHSTAHAILCAAEILAAAQKLPGERRTIHLGAL